MQGSSLAACVYTQLVFLALVQFRVKFMKWCCLQQIESFYIG